MFKQTIFAVITAGFIISSSASAGAEQISANISHLRFNAQVNALLNLGICTWSGLIALCEFVNPQPENLAHKAITFFSLLALYTGYQGISSLSQLKNLDDIDDALDDLENTPFVEEYAYYYYAASE